ncbi:MAG: M28 family peptidase [Candidatus Heimdallarchaeota archaeon]
MTFIVFGLLSFYLPYFSPSSYTIQNVNVNLHFDGDNAYEYVEDQLDIGFRIPGTQERINCASYFISKFLEIDSNFTYFLHNFTTHMTECQNILFKLNENYNNIVILGAHYDTRAKATKDPNIIDRDNPVPGANDGASGSAVLMELARVLHQNRENLSSQIWFLFFDAEDQGRDNAYGIDGWAWCEGSVRFVDEIDNFYDSLIERFECMILLDMVGGINLQFISEQYSTSSLLGEIFAIGRELGYFAQFPTNPTKGSIFDDHIAFLDIGIPAADLIINFWNNPNWPYHHTIQDDITHVENSSLEITGRTIEQFIYNNYYFPLDDPYDGNYPWNIDKDLVIVELIMILSIIFAVVAIIILFLNLIKDSNHKSLIRRDLI